ncbi:hypothetical protein [Sphaerisporangium album]|uniref:hypothetical protein n=1 Tax=Sphaerisporangium album TaxID=509200 RepID=UPI0015F1069F|nr:hypothetical protein [Sphaerisporangium album]
MTAQDRAPATEQGGGHPLLVAAHDRDPAAEQGGDRPLLLAMAAHGSGRDHGEVCA